ncbi:MAG: hypothetical protein WBC18_15830 [Ottowia sp.]
MAKPIAVAMRCPPTMARGCANGESGTPNASTQLAPKGAINQGISDTTLNHPVIAMAIKAPKDDSKTNLNGGAGGASETSKRRIGTNYPLGMAWITKAGQYTGLCRKLFLCRPP